MMWAMASPVATPRTARLHRTRQPGACGRSRVDARVGDRSRAREARGRSGPRTRPMLQLSFRRGTTSVSTSPRRQRPPQPSREGHAGSASSRPVRRDPQAPGQGPPQFAVQGRPPSSRKQKHRLQARISRPNRPAEGLSRRVAREGGTRRGTRTPSTDPSLPYERHQVGRSPRVHRLPAARDSIHKPRSGCESAFPARLLPARQRPALLDCREDDLRSRVVPEADHENSLITHECPVGPTERRWSEALDHGGSGTT